MSCRERLDRFLREENVPFEPQQHRPAYTAQEVAAAEHVSAREFAKVVMVGTDQGLTMAVLPANARVDAPKVAQAVGARDAWLAREHEFAGTFPDCEVGAMPAFGHLFGVPVVVDRALTTSEWIVTQAGNHEETVRLRYSDYERVEHPIVADIRS